MSGSFADTNTLLYFASPDPRKAEVAEGILAEGVTINVQVLNETANVFRKKWRRDWATASYFLALIRSQTTVLPLTVDVHHVGLDLAREYRVGIYDSMIIAAALLAGSETLYSEDMRDGLMVEDRLRIVNPFRGLRF